MHPNWELNPQPWHVPWWGIGPATVHFAGWCPSNRTTPVAALFILYYRKEGVISLTKINLFLDYKTVSLSFSKFGTFPQWNCFQKWNSEKKNFRFYLFIFRKRGREISLGCLSHTPNWKTNLQPRHVPWPGIEPFGLQASAQPTEPHHPGLKFWNVLSPSEEKAAGEEMLEGM